MYRLASDYENASGRLHPKDENRYERNRIKCSSGSSNQASPTTIAKVLDDAAIDFSLAYNDGLKAACDGVLTTSEGQQRGSPTTAWCATEPPRARSHPAPHRLVGLGDVRETVTVVAHPRG